MLFRKCESAQITPIFVGFHYAEFCNKAAPQK